MLSAINAGIAGANRPHQAEICTAGVGTSVGRVIEGRTLISRWRRPGGASDWVVRPPAPRLRAILPCGRRRSHSRRADGKSLRHSSRRTKEGWCVLHLRRRTYSRSSRGAQHLEPGVGNQAFPAGGWRTYKWAFLRAGLVDKIRLMIFPSVDSAKGAPCVFDSRDDEADASALLDAMTLQSSETLEDGVVRLPYRIHAAGCENELRAWEILESEYRSLKRVPPESIVPEHDVDARSAVRDRLSSHRAEKF